MTDYQLMIIIIGLAMLLTWLFIKLMNRLPDQDAIEANQYMDEILNEAIMETTYLTKEHLLKEGWKEEPNSIHILYKGEYELWMDNHTLNIAVSGIQNQDNYLGNLPILEQWEVLKDLLNIK